MIKLWQTDVDDMTAPTMKNTTRKFSSRRSTARRALLALLLTLILVTLAAGVIAWKFSQLLMPLVADYLKQYGVRQFTSADIRWRWDHAEVSEVTASGYYEGVEYLIRLQNLDVEYQWRQLFHGRVASIAINRLDAKLRQTASDSASKVAVQSISVAALLPATWWPTLPLEQLRIADLQLIVTLPQDNTALKIVGQDILLSEARQFAKGSVPVGPTLLPAAWRSWLPSGLAGTIELQGDRQTPLHAQIDLRDDEKTILALSFKLAAQPSAGTEGLRQQFTLASRLNLGNLPSRWLQALQQTVSAPDLSSARANNQVPIGLPADLQGEVLVRVQGDLSDSADTDIAAWLEDLTYQGSASADISISDWPAFDIASVRISLDSWFRGDPGQQSVGLKRPLTVAGFWQPGPRMVAAGAFATNWLQWDGQIPIAISLTSSEILDHKQQRLLLPAATLNLAAGPEKRQLTINADIVGLVADTHGVAFDTSLHSTVPLKNAPTTDLDLQAHIVGASDSPHQRQFTISNWQATGTLASQLLAVTGTFDGRAWHDGRHSFDTHLNLKDLPRLLSTAKRYHPLPIDLTLASGSGELVYNLTGTRQQKNNDGMQQRASLKLGALSGLVSNAGFEGASFEAALVSTAQWQSTNPWQLRVKHLDPGIAINDLDVSGQLLASESLARSRWRISRFRAGIFGGSVSLRQPAVYALPLESGNLTLELSDWQLSQLMDLYRDQGLQGTGTLSGVLPVQFGTDGLSVSAGKLQSLPPGGVIRFHSRASSTLARNNPQLATTLRVLENFDYNSLSAGASFAPTGELTLDLQLSGRNLNEFEGRQVNFNINIEENLYDLLQALRVTDKVLNKLEQRITQ